MNASKQHAPPPTEDLPADPAPARTEAYWALVERHANAAPPLTQSQRAELRLLFHGTTTARAEAA